MQINHGSYPMYELCREHMHAYVMAELVDDSRFDGIVTGLDQEYVYFAVPVENQPQSNSFMYSDLRNEESRIPRRFNRIIVPVEGLRNLQKLSWY